MLSGAAREPVEVSAELRALRAQAYGPAGVLSAAQLARLRELERRQHGVAAGPAPVEAFGGRSPRIRLWLAVLAVILVFALGIGVGWILFGRTDSASIGLTQEQRARGTELVAEGDYDTNSLRAMLEHDDVIVWLATADAGGSLCLIVDDGFDATAACSDVDRVARDGLVVMHERVVDGFTDVAYGTLLLTAEHEPAVHLDVQRTDE